MDKITKALKKFDNKERALVFEMLKSIKSNKVENLNHKKLKGIANIFRVRKGKIRIIYEVQNKDIKVLYIGRRKESTYDL